jgi:hypothetical protein
LPSLSLQPDSPLVRLRSIFDWSNSYTPLEPIKAAECFTPHQMPHFPRFSILHCPDEVHHAHWRKQERHDCTVTHDSPTPRAGYLTTPKFTSQSFATRDLLPHRPCPCSRR